ncbi:hypothetical protein JHE00_15090 [Prauserella sp. ASG 168]|uniref:Uncharacterized protein n=1 Tax=Prauserella cavernicola TaxID=2800127 RepID=A0A934QUN4_9PSEU|nr:hypothetical protein [Prauserella cavernicola]
MCRGSTGERHGQARIVRHRAVEVETAAAHCWTALLAGCDSAGRWELAPRLRRLSEATSLYTGPHWWFADGAVHRRRVAGAQSSIEEAIEDGDGGDFARAFIGYDHAMASAVVCAASPDRKPSRA